MVKNRINLQGFHALAAVHERGSITDAAHLLGVSQPALTRAIQHLEASVGFAVLERQARGVTLTSQGLDLLPHARSIAEMATATDAELQRWLTEQPSEVRLATSDLTVSTLLPAALALLYGSSPAIRVHVVDATLPRVLQLLREGEVDLAIGPAPQASHAERFRVEPLLEVPLVIALGRDAPSTGARSIQSLAGLGWVYQRALEGINDELSGLFRLANSAAPSRILACESVTTALQFIQSEGFAGLLPEPLAREASEAGGISIVPIKEALPVIKVSMFYPAEVTLSPSSRALYSALRMAAQVR
jgi:LysR family transcriptional regulator, regulator of abg operon